MLKCSVWASVSVSFILGFKKNTNLVDLPIGAISNHFHQLENPSWILDFKDKANTWEGRKKTILINWLVTVIAKGSFGVTTGSAQLILDKEKLPQGYVNISIAHNCYIIIFLHINF